MADTDTVDSVPAVQPDFGSNDSRNANTVDATETDGSPDKGTQPESGDSNDGRRAQDTQTALKDMQAKFHAVAEQKAQMEQQLAELKGAVSVLTQQSSEVATETDWVEKIGELIPDDQFVSDPVKAMKSQAEMLAKNLRADMAKVLQKRDEYWEKKLAERESFGSSKSELKPAFDALSGEEWFKDLKPEKQIAAAKKFMQGQNASSGLKPPNVGLAGTGRTAGQTPKNERQATARATADRIWPTNKGRTDAMPIVGLVLE